MSDVVDKLRLKEMAEEDIYFAKQDIALIEALHEKKLAKLAKCGVEDRGLAQDFEKRFESLTKANKRRPRRLSRAVHALLAEIKAVCDRRR